MAAELYPFGMDWKHFIVSVAVILPFVGLNTLFLVWMERKVAGHMQVRIGPKEVGPYGLLQTLADGIKLLAKQIITPRESDFILFRLAPHVALIPAVMCFLVIPFSSYIQARDIDFGVLLLLALAMLNGLGILMAGWGSANKYALIGAFRSVAQGIAYEIPMLISILSVIIMVKSFKMQAIIEYQSPLWNIFYQPIAFLVYFICAVAESNRSPFDLPEAESELVAGFHTEYAGMGFGIFFLAEYSYMFVSCSLATVLFLGGWKGPVLPGIVWFVMKVYLLLFIIMWFRWTFPRTRFDQLMNFSWKILIPVSFANLIITALVMKIW